MAKKAAPLDVVVVGGGIVGLAIARALALSGREVTLLEAEARLGQHTSSRNSEVIHAGIYYPPGSLKARLCVTGKQLLYDYAAEHGIGHRRLGKLIVASDQAEIPKLESILATARASGVDDLEWLDPSEIARLEPQVRAVRGLFSPSTGIIDSHALLEALRRDAVAAGAQIVTQSSVLGGELRSGGFDLQVGGADPFRLRCRSLVNAAGLWATQVARSLRGLPAASIPRQHFAKGHYFALRGTSPFSHLVYPVPVTGGLGVHVTLDLSGAARFGPDVQWVDGVDYGFDETRAVDFYARIRAYFPELRDGSLVPSHTGVRPKLSGPGEPAADFVIQTEREHGVSGLTNLYGIESPGLTASLALAQELSSAAE